MAITSGFFNSKNGDRKYNADQMSMFFDKLISSGVYPNPSTNLQVVEGGGGMRVKVLAGRGMIDCRWINNDATETLTFEQSDPTLDRIDAVVMVLDLNDSVRDGTIRVKKGTPATTPVAPVMTRNAYVKEYCLATVYIRAMESQITQNNITDTRANTAVCGWVTGLIDQVDTSTLFMQWQDAYQRFYEEAESMFDTWFTHIKDTLSTATLIQTFDTYYTTIYADETVIPIEIDRYVRTVDILQVYINGLKLTPVLDYNITGDYQITLTKAVDKGTVIQFTVYKSVDGSDAISTLEMVSKLGNSVTHLESQTDLFYKNQTITSAIWVQSGAYYVANVTNAHIMANDIVNVNFAIGSIPVVETYEVLGVTDSYDGGFRLYSRIKPTTSITFDYVVMKGKVMV